MNTSRVPGVSRNSGWQAVDAEIASRRGSQIDDHADRDPRKGNRAL